MLLVTGQIGKPHGIRGEVSVVVRTDEPEERFTAGSVFITEVPRDRRVSAGPAVAVPGVPYAELHCHSNYSFGDGASHPEELVRELYCKMKTQQLRPRVLVSYVREPYVYGAGNVRVTFDSNIRTSLFRRDFADGAVPDISAADSPGAAILEVKFDAFLPEIIRSLLQTGTLRQQAFSKYGACRRFG